MKVYIVLAQNVYDKEILYVFKRKKDAVSAQQVEKENYRASGSYDDIIIETWEVE